MDQRRGRVRPTHGGARAGPVYARSERHARIPADPDGARDERQRRAVFRVGGDGGGAGPPRRHQPWLWLRFLIQ